MEFLVIIIIIAIIIFLVNKFKDNKKYSQIRENLQNLDDTAVNYAQKNYCGFCGAKLKPGMPFCEKCGHSVNDQNS